MSTYNILIEGQIIPIPEEIGSDDKKVRMTLAPYYPDAANALITRTTKDDVVTVNVVKRAGTKGAGGKQSPLQKLKRKKGGRNPAIALYIEIQSDRDLDPEALLAIDSRIEDAVQAGQADGEALKAALKRLNASQPVPAPAVVVGF